MRFADHGAFKVDTDWQFLGNLETELAARNGHGVAVDTLQEAVPKGHVNLIKELNERPCDIRMLQIRETFHTHNVSSHPRLFQKNKRTRIYADKRGKNSAFFRVPRRPRKQVVFPRPIDGLNKASYYPIDMIVVPIFPLPNVVLFPKTVIPLHIFEERYRTMTRDALAGDRMIVTALLCEGWENEYEKSPAVHDIACLSKIETYEEVEDGKYNLVLAGVQRVRLIREIPHSPYRLAEVENLKDAACDEQSAEVIQRRNRMAGLFARFAELAASGSGKSRTAELVSQYNFETLVNTVAAALNLPAQEKQGLLEIDDLTQRCDVLIPVLRQQLETLILVRRFEHIKPTDPSRN